MAIITPAIKDKVLSSLLSYEETTLFFDFNKLGELLDIEQKYAIIILKQFERLGLVNLGYYDGKDIVIISLNAEIYDFFNHGSFTGQEELLRANIEKLNLELLNLSKELESSKLDTINKITAIAGSVATALGLFNK